MIKRPKLRMTNADYVAIAVSPALIMALVGSLVFFLIEVLYVGQFQGRLNYVFALFVFATVLIGRISIEMGSERAVLFALPLGIAMLLVLAKFVPHDSAYGPLINIGLLAITWWSTHKLTWDCTLIDDQQDASGEGLMQRVGIDELPADEEPEITGNELLAENTAKKPKQPHSPGLWVLYFSLAALPLFGIGQKMIPTGSTGRRQYAFALLAVYVASGLALLVTTSFLGLRRYLRQRRVEMPTPMAVTWVASGATLILVVMLLAALVPRPSAEYAISQVPWQTHSPSDLQASKTSIGNDGTEKQNQDESTRKVTNDKTHPDATATREGEQPTTTTKNGDKQSHSEENENANDQPPNAERRNAPGENPQQSKAAQPSETSTEQPTKQSQSDQSQSDQSQSDQSPSDQTQSGQTSNEQPPSEQPTTQQSTSAKPSEGESPREQSPQSPKSDTTEKETEAPKQPADENANPTSDSSRLPKSLPDLVPSMGGLSTIFKLVLYAAISLALGYLAWNNRLAIAKAIADIIQQIRDFLARLFGRSPKESVVEVDEEVTKKSATPPRPFSSFANPFASDKHRSLPPDELVRYTFEAFEAWAHEQGYQRSPDQTPLELIRKATAQQPPIQAEALRLARLYNEAAYAPGSASVDAVKKLHMLWTLLRQTASRTTETSVVENSA